jgi:CheY-like chemotaxis protein
VADLHFEPEGLRAVFRIPAVHLHPVAPPVAHDPVREEPLLPLIGLSVLLVEDQALIAMDMEEMLRELGVAAVKTSHGREHALAQLKAYTPDVAVLDFSLGKETSADIAAVLTARGIRFIFSTGYREGTGIPAQFADVPVVRKPASVDALAESLRKALSA